MSALLTLPEAAEFLRVSRSTVYRLTAAGRLKVVRVGRQLRYRQADLDQLDAAADLLSPPDTQRLLQIRAAYLRRQADEAQHAAEQADQGAA